jgi:hypothetical protein
LTPPIASAFIVPVGPRPIGVVDAKLGGAESLFLIHRIAADAVLLRRGEENAGENHSDHHHGSERDR